MIMAIKKEILFKDGYFEGFREKNILDYEAQILANYSYYQRTAVEHDKNLKQPIGYAVIINPKLKKVFAYQRANKEKEYSEKRLWGRWSWGVGGHVEKDDLEKGNPIRISTLREVEEEAGLNAKEQDLDILGYINNDTDDVGSVHIGILYVLKTDLEEFKSTNQEIITSGMKTIEELEEIINSQNYQVEEWAKISWPVIKNYLKN